MLGAGVTVGDNELFTQTVLLFLVATAVEALNGVSISQEYGDSYGQCGQEPLDPHPPFIVILNCVHL